MNYELAKELKEAGFPQPCLDKDGLAHGDWVYPSDPYRYGNEDKGIYRPTLEELIEACGEEFDCLERLDDNDWIAYGGDTDDFNQLAHTPTEAVAMLWLALNKK